MGWQRDPDAVDWMVKEARSPAESRLLEGEIGVLRRVAHPGVIELGPVGTGPDGRLTARTRYVGPSLEQFGPLAPAEVAGLGAALATVLADLHDLGCAYGRLEPAHVLLDPCGRPVLCGFGPEAPAADSAPDDVDALRQLLSDSLDGPAPSRLGRLLHPSSRRGRAMTARALADALAHCLPEVRLPTVTPTPLPVAPTRRTPVTAPAPSFVKRHPLRAAAVDEVDHADAVDHAGAVDDDSNRRPTAMAVAAIVLVFVVGAAVTLTFVHHHRARTPAAVPCPTADNGCVPVPVRDGMFVTAAGRFAIDLKPVVVVVGRWRCGDESLPAALDPATGQIWAWRTWPGRKVISAQTLAHIPGASGLKVEPEASGCDRLLVRRDRGGPVMVAPAEGT